VGSGAVRFTLGRILQFGGLVLVGGGFVTGVVRDDLKFEERMLFVGGALFLLGWLLVRPFRDR
jgi:hypothetical protein